MQRLDKTLFAGCAVAAVLAIGCGNHGDTTGNRTDPANRPGEPGSAPTAGTAAESREKAMTLTGCLQETKGVTGGYILTRANAKPGSSAPVGTSGRQGSDVEEKQMTAAAKSYRLSGETDELKNLVGHEIRVTGSLAEKGDLAGTSPTAGESKDRAKAGDIDESDLPKLDVETVSNIADKCGTTGKTQTEAKPKSKS